MDMGIKRAIMASKRSKKAYDDGCANVAKAGKVLQDHANLVKDKEALEWQVKATEAMLSKTMATLDFAIQVARDAEAAKGVVEGVLEEMEWSKAIEIEAVVQQAIRQYRSSEEFTILLDKEVGLEMVDLIYHFKRFNLAANLNLNFAADPPTLPKGVTKEMIEDYEG